VRNAFEDPLGFTEPQVSTDKALSDLFDICKSMHKTFSTREGKIALAWLRKATLEAAAWSPSLAQSSSIEAANAHAYAREGQNALVRDIENKIELASKAQSVEDLYKLLGGTTE